MMNRLIVVGAAVAASMLVASGTWAESRKCIKVETGEVVANSFCDRAERAERGGHHRHGEMGQMPMPGPRGEMIPGGPGGQGHISNDELYDGDSGRAEGPAQAGR